MTTPESTSAELYDACGINTHLNYTNLVSYGDFNCVLTALRALGVKHVRDGLHHENDDGDNVGYQRWVQLSRDLGIRFCALFDPRSNLGGLTPDLLNQYWWKSGMSWEFLENANEWDNSGDASWATDLRSSTQALWAAATAMAQGVNMRVVGPSLAYASNGSKVGNLSQYMHFGNLHPYPGGAPPESPLVFPQQATYAAMMSGTLPIVVTESGNHTATKVTSGQPGVSELAQAKYTLRLLLYNFSIGLVRTYLYELMDEGPADLTNANVSWGLVRWDGSWKPSFHAVKNLLGLLSKRPAIPQPLTYALTGTPVSSLFLQNDDQSWLLILWQKAAVYSQAIQTDVANPAVPVSLAVPAGYGIELYTPLIQPELLSTTTSTAELAVPDHPLVVKITKPTATWRG